MKNVLNSCYQVVCAGCPKKHQAGYDMSTKGSSHKVAVIKTYSQEA